MHGRIERITAVVTIVATALGVYAAVRLADGDGEPESAARAAAPTPERERHGAGADRPREGASSSGADRREEPRARPRAERPAMKVAGSAAAPTPETTFALDRPSGTYPVVWVRRGQATEIRTQPGGGEVVDVARERTEFGSPTVFGVVRRHGDWVGVTTPKLPNGTLGWIKLDPRRLNAGWTPLSVVVDLSDRHAVLRRADGATRTFAVTVGAPGSETPTGRFAVTDTFREGLNPVYGCCAVALSATQPNTPSGWIGGSRIAIHGTYGPLGAAVSLGCVRAADAEVANLVRRLPLGTPVFIRA